MYTKYEIMPCPLRAFVLEDSSFPIHMQMSIEMIYILSGQYDVTVDANCYHLNAGDFIMIMPNQMHSFFPIAKSHASLQCMICPLNECGEYAPLLERLKPKNPVLVSNSMPDDFSHTIHMILSYQNKNHGIMRSYMQLLFSFCYSLYDFQKIDVKSGNDHIEKLVSYIYQHLEEDLSLETLSKKLGLNKYAISRLINTKLATSLPVLVNTLRLDRSIALLLNTSKTVTEIALECGYDSLRNYNRQFHNMFHVSPREYRKKSI